MESMFNKIISFWSKSKFLIIIFITLAALMVASALIELSQSKSELYDLMKEQAKSTIESIMIASENSLLTNEELTALIEQRLLDNATLISALFNNDHISNTFLRDICEKNNLFRINIFNDQGDKLFYSHEMVHITEDEKYSPAQLYNPIFSGEVDTLIIGIIPARYEEGRRFAVAVSAKNNSAVVVNIDAEEIINFRKNIGFGPLLRNIVTQNSSLIFAALQDTSTILAASGNVSELETIQSSDFLSASLIDTTFATRVASFDSTEVFEVVHPFDYKERQIGLLRLGLSMEPIHEINSRIYSRLIIITIILVVIGSIIIAMMFVLQRLGILRKQYSTVETYSSNIINNASDAIIVYNSPDGIKIFNNMAERLFNIKENNIVGKSPNELFTSAELKLINNTSSPVIQLNYKKNDSHKILLISKTDFTIAKELNSILLIRDITEEKLMEEQLERNQRLTAMGELASGVAHEIRNPLNSISMIVQQLDKDFIPTKDEDEYHELSNIVYKEIKRINQTIKDFLLFAKPEKIKTSTFSITDLLTEIDKQYSALLIKQNIRLVTTHKWQGKVKWDFNKIKQVLINLIDNAVDSISNEGAISISLNKVANDLIITVEDNGKGISTNDQSKIFNLYYTSKANGTGIGLSIVQRIIFEHNGTISVESVPDKGTTFTLKIPISVD